MIDFSQWLDSFVRASWQGAALIAFVWIIIQLGKNSSRISHSWIWPVAMAKFLLAAFLVWELPVLPSISKTQQATPQNMNGTGEQIANVPQIMFAIWLIVVLFIAIRSAREYILLKQLASAAKTSSTRITDICERIAGRPVIVKGHCDVPVPFVFGVFKPIVLLPTDLTHELSEEQLKMLLAHEIAHINRRDTVTAMYVFVCQTLFFFHPAVWLARREWEIAREAACDQFAMQQTNTSRRDYADMLIKVSQGPQRAPAFALSAVPAVKTLRRRINNMKETTTKMKGVARIGWLIALALIGAAALPFAFVQKRPVPKVPADSGVIMILSDADGNTYGLVVQKGGYEFVQGDLDGESSTIQFSFVIDEPTQKSSFEVSGDAPVMKGQSAAGMSFETLQDENGNTYGFDVDENVQFVIDEN